MKSIFLGSIHPGEIDFSNSKAAAGGSQHLSFLIFTKARRKFMWNSRICSALMLLMLSFQAGCGSPAPPQTPALDTPNWPELKHLGSPEIMKPLYFAKDMKDVAAFKRALTSTEFGDALEKFAKSKIPAGYDSAERKAAQEEIVAKFQKAIELAKSNASLKDLTDNYDAAAKAIATAGAPRKKS